MVLVGGCGSVISVRIGKHLEAALEASDRDAARGMRERLLADPVIKDFALDVTERV